MHSITTRPAVIKDVPTLHEFEQGIIEAERPFDSSLKEGEFHYYNLIELIESPEAEVVVALLDKEIVGSGFIQIKESKPYSKYNLHGYIGLMYVKPAHRGKGIIQLVTDSLTSWSNSKNIKEVRLKVYDENSSAVRAYQKAGFMKDLVEMRLEL
ncbi:MAG: GNAT family N-acetyltransferase [Cyclobacteriaceae bacterium]